MLLTDRHDGESLHYPEKLVEYYGNDEFLNVLVYPYLSKETFQSMDGIATHYTIMSYLEECFQWINTWLNSIDQQIREDPIKKPAEIISSVLVFIKRQLLAKAENLAFQMIMQYYHYKNLKLITADDERINKMLSEDEKFMKLLKHTGSFFEEYLNRFSRRGGVKLK